MFVWKKIDVAVVEMLGGERTLPIIVLALEEIYEVLQDHPSYSSPWSPFKNYTHVCYLPCTVV